MTSVSVNKRTESLSQVSWVEHYAKRAILAMLQRIRVGHLTVYDGEDVYEFGESMQASRVSAVIHVQDPSVYRRVLFNGTIGSGEAYIAGSWRTPDLLSVIRLMVLNLNMLQSMDDKWRWAKSVFIRLLQFSTRNSMKGSKSNIAAHYDLSNQFFSLFLDRSMMYSAAIYATPDSTLEEAAEYKLKHICERLALCADDHLIEIGSGWGGMAIYAAKHYGCKVTTTTISAEQYEFAKQKVAQEGLQDRITLLCEDYRNLTGQYDKLVSIEMIEAVGHDYYPSYFRQCASLLKPNGLMLIQAITMPEQRYERAKKSVDFIQRYIFPGGALPSLAEVQRNIANYTDMQLVNLDDITLHYAQTLADWKNRFLHRLDEVKALGFSDQFIRMWEFYLNYCEGGFRERVIGTSQLLFAKPDCRALPVVSVLGQ